MIDYRNTQQLFGEGVRRTNGSKARRYNLLAVKLIAEMSEPALDREALKKCLQIF